MIVNEFRCFSANFDGKLNVEGRLFELSDRDFCMLRPEIPDFCWLGSLIWFHESDIFDFPRPLNSLNFHSFAFSLKFLRFLCRICSFFDLVLLMNGVEIPDKERVELLLEIFTVMHIILLYVKQPGNFVFDDQN